MLEARLSHRPQPRGAVGKGFVQQEGETPVDAGLDVIGHLDMLARYQHRVRRDRVEACACGSEAGAPEGVLQLLPRSLLGVHHADDLVPEAAGRLGHAPPVVAVGEKGYAHALGPHIQPCSMVT